MILEGAVNAWARGAGNIDESVVLDEVDQVVQHRVSLLSVSIMGLHLRSNAGTEDAVSVSVMSILRRLLDLVHTSVRNFYLAREA